jgi:hypothetical protein
MNIAGCRGRDLNPGYPGYEVGVLTTLPRWYFYCLSGIRTNVGCIRLETFTVNKCYNVFSGGRVNIRSVTSTLMMETELISESLVLTEHCCG